MSSPSVSVARMRELDHLAIETFGIPSIILMENAGRVLADEIERMLKAMSGVKVLIVCGCGNNGGDGFVSARHLINRGYAVTVAVVGDVSKLSADACLNYDILNRMKGYVRTMPQIGMVGLSALIETADVVCDALFGIGLNADVRGNAAYVIENINASEKPVVACDVPSGINADTGVVQGIAVKAAVTVTMGALKNGLCLDAAVAHVGQIVVADISLPQVLLNPH